MKKIFIMAAFLLPGLLLAENIKSNSNLLFSYYKPSKNKFIKNAKNNYLSNSRLKEAYSDQDTNPVNALLYALAMDYVHSNGSDEIKNAYETAAMSINGAFGYISILQYADFLIRTKRYSGLSSIKSSMCGRDFPQCTYYKIVAKHLTNQVITKEECKESMLFLPMRKMTKSICD